MLEDTQTLMEGIRSVLADKSLESEEKGKRLAEKVTQPDLKSILPTNGVVALKEPLKPKTKGMKTIAFSIHKVYFDMIILGNKPIEFRDWKNPYYQNKCSYTEGGKRYLIPFDAIVLYVGRGAKALTATVALKNITCDGTNLMFWLGKVLWTNSPLWHKDP